MALWSTSPPEQRTRLDNWPTLLFSWWCTSFAAVIILVRVCGRKVRVGVLFREDKIIMISLIPLFIRMALIHVVLIYGTNNVQTAGLTDRQIHLRSIGARLVLPARIFYCMFIWVSKFTVSEFLKRIARTSWKPSYERGLHFIRIFLFATFSAVVIATLAECQPFHEYWQVVPLVKPECRQGYAQLLTMGTADIITDVLLVAWPIPIIVQSKMPLKRKISLVALFSLSLTLIGITLVRMIEVPRHLGRQQYRTVWASCEILASAAVSNAVVLGSYVRDRGVKRNKYKPGSALESVDRVPTRRPTLFRTDSDDDLFHSIGCRTPAHLRETTSPVARPAPVALTLSEVIMHDDDDDALMTPSPAAPLFDPAHLDPHDAIPPLVLAADHRTRSPHDSADALPKLDKYPVDDDGSDTVIMPPHPHFTTPFSARDDPDISLFDVGGLLESNTSGNSAPPHREPSPTSPATATAAGRRVSSSATRDFATSPISPVQALRRGSRGLFGGRLSPTTSLSPSQSRDETPTPLRSGRRWSSHAQGALDGVRDEDAESSGAEGGSRRGSGALRAVVEAVGRRASSSASASASASASVPAPAPARRAGGDGGGGGGGRRRRRSGAMELQDVGGLLG